MRVITLILGLIISPLVISDKPGWSIYINDSGWSSVSGVSNGWGLSVHESILLLSLTTMVIVNCCRNIWGLKHSAAVGWSISARVGRNKFLGVAARLA